MAAIWEARETLGQQYRDLALALGHAGGFEARAAAPIALGPDAGEALWFLGSLATIKASGKTTAGRAR